MGLGCAWRPGRAKVLLGNLNLQTKISQKPKSEVHFPFTWTPGVVNLKPQAPSIIKPPEITGGKKIIHGIWAWPPQPTEREMAREEDRWAEGLCQDRAQPAELGDVTLQLHTRFLWNQSCLKIAALSCLPFLPTLLCPLCCYSACRAFSFQPDMKAMH